MKARCYLILGVLRKKNGFCFFFSIWYLLKHIFVYLFFVELAILIPCKGQLRVEGKGKGPTVRKCC